MTPAKHGRRIDARMAQRNAEILALRGTLSYRAIAAKIGVSLGTVSGVCFRATRPRSPRSRLHGGPAVRRSISIPLDLYEQLTAHARRSNTNFNQLCRDAARRAMEDAARAADERSQP